MSDVFVLEELNKIDREIRQANREKDQAEGAKKSILENMKKAYGVSTKKEAKKKIQEMEKEMDKLVDEIEAKFTDLQENYSWEE